MAKSSTPPGRSGATSVPVPAAAHGAQIGAALYRVARLHRMMAGNLLRPVGLHPTQALRMIYLWEPGPQRQTDLTRLLDSDAATMTRSIRRLEHAGFVRRTPAADDRRAFYIEATPASRALQPEVEQIWNEIEACLVGDVSARERQTVQRFLLSLEQRLIEATEPRA